MDCAGTKTEMLDFTRTLAKQLAQKKIRVNAIAHGSISTSRASANFRLNDTITFDERRSPQHCHPSADVASAFLFVAAESGFANNTGQIFRVDGGREI
jgi:NAD(P)-dependent dehydrogenase (short-subunit alcohol dehydrogenase family)